MAVEEASLRREGQHWAISYAGITCRLRHTVGMHHIAYLLGRPNQRVDAGRLNALAKNLPESPVLDGGGMGGADQVRVNVTRALRVALRRIGRHHPLLARHLECTIRTGKCCVYLPDPRVPIVWTID